MFRSTKQIILALERRLWYTKPHVMALPVQLKCSTPVMCLEMCTIWNPKSLLTSQHHTVCKDNWFNWFWDWTASVPSGTHGSQSDSVSGTTQRPLPYYMQVDICNNIAQALNCLHSNGIIHCNLSSRNILLSAGKAKVDISTSYILRKDPECPGKPPYMPPEGFGMQYTVMQTELFLIWCAGCWDYY